MPIPQHVSEWLTLHYTSQLAFACRALHTACKCKQMWVFWRPVVASDSHTYEKDPIVERSAASVLKQESPLSRANSRQVSSCAPDPLSTCKVGLMCTLVLLQSLQSAAPCQKFASYWASAVVSEMLHIPTVQLLPIPPVASTVKTSHSVPNPVAYVPQYSAGFTVNMVRCRSACLPVASFS